MPSTVVTHDLGANVDAQPFEQALLSPQGRLEVMTAEARIIEIEKRSFVAVGRELRKIRDRIRHELGWGYWYGWLDMTKRARTTASARIRAADWADEENNSAVVAELPAAVAYRAAGADNDVRRQVLSWAADGKKLSVDDVQALIDGRQLLDADIPAAGASTDKTGEPSKLVSGRSLKTTGGASIIGNGPDGMKNAYQLIERLRGRFRTGEIADLLDLWQRTNADELRKVLAETGSIPVRRIASTPPLSAK